MYEWKITKLDRKTSNGFVTGADWTLSKTEGETVKIIYGKVGFDGQMNTPFHELTEEQILGWIWEQVSKTETEEKMKTVHINGVSPEGLPWE